MKNLEEYVGQQAKLVRLYQAFCIDSPKGWGMGEIIGYHLDGNIARLEKCDEVKESFALQFADGEVFPFGSTTSVEVSKKKKELIVAARKRTLEQADLLTRQLSEL